jgi:bifunctional enzyme CysN/CysC
MNLRRNARSVIQKKIRLGAGQGETFLREPRCIWFTGLSGAGKTTLARMLESHLRQLNYSVYVLDGDDLRQGLNSDLNFSDQDRRENIRRVAHVAQLMVDAGMVAIVATISPFQRDRIFARRLFKSNQFIEVFVDTPLEECERRDPKGLYKHSRSGQLLDFTGITSAYEAPDSPEVHLMCEDLMPDEAFEQLLSVIGMSGTP